MNRILLTHVFRFLKGRQCSAQIVLVLLVLVIGVWPTGCAAQNVPAPRTLQANASEYVPHIPPQALRYQRQRRTLALFGMAWNLLGLWLILRTGAAARLRDRSGQKDFAVVPPFRAVLLYYALFSLILRLWNLPVGLAGLAIEHRFGFSHETLAGYFSDTLLDFAFNLPLAILLWGGLRLMARSPRHWWQILWTALVPVLVFLFVLQPVVIAPAFNHFTPLPEGPLKEHILTLAGKAGISGARVFVEDTSRRTRHVNAYVTGIGPSTRIVINDTALQQLPEDQILAMVGHEMGHYVEGHIWFGMLGAILGAGGFLWLLSRLLPALVTKKVRGRHRHGLTDLAVLPLILLLVSVFLLVQEPLASAISRYQEHRADVFGLRVTQRSAAMARLFVGFAERDYSDPDPPALLQFWFGTHPTLHERIDFALESLPPGSASAPQEEIKAKAEPPR